MFAIPSDTPPREFGSFARIFLLERPFDAPVVRQIQQAPLAVIEVRLGERDIFRGIARWARLREQRGVGAQLRACGQQPVFEFGVAQCLARAVGIAFRKTPTVVKINAFARRRGVGAAGGGV